MVSIPPGKASPVLVGRTSAGPAVPEISTKAVAKRLADAAPLKKILPSDVIDVPHQVLLEISRLDKDSQLLYTNVLQIYMKYVLKKELKSHAISTNSLMALTDEVIERMRDDVDMVESMQEAAKLLLMAATKL